MQAVSNNNVLTNKQKRKRAMNRKRKYKKREEFKHMPDEEKVVYNQKMIEKKRRNGLWMSYLPVELIHIIGSLLTLRDIMNLAICSKLLNSYIERNEFWRIIFIDHYNEKPNKDNEGKWRGLYVEKYADMNMAVDKLMWVIENNYYRHIHDVLTSKNFSHP